MKLTSKRKPLLDALNSVSVAMSTKSANPFSQFVLLTCTDKLSLVCDCIQLRAEATAACEVKQPGVALVSFAKLSALLMRDFEDVTLTVEKDQLLVQMGGESGLRAHVPMMAADSFPAEREEKEQQAFVILDGKTFSYAVSVACGCAGDGATHPWSTGLLIQDDGKNLIIAAGDGKQFSRLLLPTSGNEFKAVPPAKLIRPLAAAFAVSESLTMFVFERSIIFRTESLTLSIQQQDTGYSNGVMDVCNGLTELCKNSVTVDRSQLVQALQTGAAMLDQDDYGCSFEITTNPQEIVVHSRSKSNGGHKEAIPVKVAVPFARKRINHQMVIAHLRSLDCETVTLWYATDEQTPEGPKRGAVGFMITLDGNRDWSLFNALMTQ